MLGFVVRKCNMDLGHPPTADEFAAWANGQEENGHRYSLFGRPFSDPTITVIPLLWGLGQASKTTV